MATKRPSSFADIMAAAKVVCQETEFEKRKRQRNKFRNVEQPPASSAPAPAPAPAPPPPETGGTTFKFSVRDKQPTNSHPDMGHSMTTFRVPPPFAPPPTPFNTLPPVPFTFSVPLVTSKVTNAPRPATADAPGTSVAHTSYSAPGNISSSASQPPDQMNYVSPVAEPSSSSVNRSKSHPVKGTSASSWMKQSGDSSSSRETSSGPPEHLSRLTRLNRVELALTLLHDGGLELSDFLSDVLDPDRSEFSFCQDKLYEEDGAQLMRILDLVISHKKGKQHLKEWIKSKVSDASVT